MQHGFRKIVREIHSRELLNIGHIGKAYSLLANAKEIFDVDFKTLSTNPLATICDKPTVFPAEFFILTT